MVGRSMLEGVAAEMRSKESPESLVIRTFAHSLWLWQRLGSEQWRSSVVLTRQKYLRTVTGQTDAAPNKQKLGGTALWVPTVHSG